MQNKHVHYYNNEIVVHSHPFEKSNENPVNSHSHTKSEVLFYNLINFDYYSHSGDHSIETGNYSTPNIYITAEEKAPYNVWLYNTGSRDPPVAKH